MALLIKRCALHGNVQPDALPCGKSNEK
ncbi:unnamed protein product [Ectocarpus sp. CCAP 1310/34]|nr:unnamed protein product [Ectocarpus sp. CCAP 1310/34]